jgi:hypothetical protein
MDHLEHVALRSLRIKGSSCAFLPVVFPVAGGDCKRLALAARSAAARRPQVSFWEERV